MTFARKGFIAFHETENGEPTGTIVFRVTGSISEAKLTEDECKQLAEYITH